MWMSIAKVLEKTLSAPQLTRVTKRFRRLRRLPHQGLEAIAVPIKPLETILLQASGGLGEWMGRLSSVVVDSTWSSGKQNS